MEYATSINGFFNAFNPDPLKEDELNDFYCDGTIAVRTGNKHVSPIEDIIDECQTPRDRNSFLLVGHRGCGKSTELNKMAIALRNQKHYVRNIDCKKELNLLNLTHTDIMTLMGEALIDIANDIGCDLEKGLAEQIYDFWDEKEITSFFEKTSEIDSEAGIELKSPTFLGVLKWLAKVKADLKFNETQRNNHRKQVKNRASEWIDLLKKLSDEITKKSNGKQPILIFEEIDKADSETALKIFAMYSSTLTEVSFPVIYTFPIALYYSTQFSALNGFFISRCFPMIKQENVDGSSFIEGTDILKQIVEKRADLSLFEDGVLENMINKTGGSLRNLFEVILNSARTAKRANLTKISENDAKLALDMFKSSLVRCIERKNYAFLADIYRGNRQKIENKEMLLEMLNAGVVLEYNGQHWFNLHPLVAEFLEEQKLTNEGFSEEGINNE